MRTLAVLQILLSLVTLNLAISSQFPFRQRRTISGVSILPEIPDPINHGLSTYPSFQHQGPTAVQVHAQPRLRRQGKPYQYQKYPYNQDPYRQSSLLGRASASATSESDSSVSPYHANNHAIKEYLQLHHKNYKSKGCPPNNEKRNKFFTKKMYEEILGNKDLTNVHKYFLPSYIQHNPNVADGLEPFIAAFEEGGILSGPPVTINWINLGADADLVWLHHYRNDPVTGEPSRVFADVFRIECGKIAEHWDVIQSAVLATPAANPHPFF